MRIKRAIIASAIALGTLAGSAERDERDALEAEVGRLMDALDAAQEELTWQGKRCRSCGGKLACPQCSRGRDHPRRKR